MKLAADPVKTQQKALMDELRYTKEKVKQLKDEIKHQSSLSQELLNSNFDLKKQLRNLKQKRTSILTKNEDI